MICDDGGDVMVISMMMMMMMMMMLQGHLAQEITVMQTLCVLVSSWFWSAKSYLLARDIDWVSIPELYLYLTPKNYTSVAYVQQWFPGHLFTWCWNRQGFTKIERNSLDCRATLCHFRDSCGTIVLTTSMLFSYVLPCAARDLGNAAVFHIMANGWPFIMGHVPRHLDIEAFAGDF